MTTTHVSARGRLHALHALPAVAAALAVLTAGSASAAAPSRSAPKNVSALTTRALLAKVHRAYLHAPAVELSVIPRQSTLRFPRRFVLVLRSGVVVAEEFTRTGRDATTLVARRHQATYSRAAGAKCWRRLSSSNPQTLEDVGIPFPYSRLKTKALQPRRTAFGWKVLSANRAKYWFLALTPRRPKEKYKQRFITYAIYARSHLIKSITVQQPSERAQKFWVTATLRVSVLTKAPRLPVPAPAC